MSGRSRDKKEVGTVTSGHIIAVVLTIAIVIGVVLWFRPWEGESGTVRFDYQMMFKYLGPENGEPLENLFLRFPAPQIDNDFAANVFSSWELYRIENDNTLMLQANAGGVIDLQGPRSSQLGIFLYAIERSEYGPTLARNLDRLYSQEIFLDYGQIQVPKEKADAVTLRDYSVQADWSWAYWYTLKAEQENTYLDFSFVTRLYRENTLIEQYEVIWENQTWGAFSLPRTI